MSDLVERFYTSAFTPKELMSYLETWPDDVMFTSAELEFYSVPTLFSDGTHTTSLLRLIGERPVRKETRPESLAS